VDLRWRRGTFGEGLADVKEAPALVPPDQGGGTSSRSTGGSRGAALIVTATPSGAGLGLRLDASDHGIAVGYCEDDFEVEGAEQSGSRVEIVRCSDSGESDSGEWVARGSGRVQHNGAVFGERTVSAGDAIRVENTFFRFLRGADIDGQYYETIYHLTIVDFATEIHNTRYLLEALDKELSRASNTGSVVVAATIRFEREAASAAASHDVLGDVAGALRRHLSREQVVARSGDLEITVVSPNSSPEAVERALRAALQPLGKRTARMRLGVAASQTRIDSSRLLARSRSNARPWPG
jgi:two-component system, cell cycle response regulator